MSYYRAGGYYSAGGFFDWLGGAVKSVAHVIAPIANIVGNFVPGAGLIGSIAGRLAGEGGGTGGGQAVAAAIPATVSTPAGTPGMTARIAAVAPHRLRGRRFRRRRRRG